MESVIVGDNDFNNEFNYQQNKEKYYACFKKAVKDETIWPKTAEDMAVIIKIIKFGTDINRNRPKYMKEMDVIQENGKDLLIAKRSNQYTDPILEIVPYSLSYDAIAEAHLAVNHSIGEDFYAILLKKYSMPRKWITKFLDVCNVCSKLKVSHVNSTNRNIVIENGTILNHKANLAHVVEWSVYKMQANDEFSFVFEYINLNSFYVILRPLKTANTDEITLELLKIFADFGVPYYYICDKSSKWLSKFDDNYAKKAITAIMKKEFPKRIISKHPQANIIEVLKNNIQGLIRNLKDWPVSMKNVQWLFNATDYYLSNKPYYIHFRVLPNNTDEDLDERDTLAAKGTKIKCSHCEKDMYKSYQCTSCYKLFHITCCDTLLFQTKPKQIGHKCISCRGNRVLKKDNN